MATRLYPILSQLAEGAIPDPDFPYWALFEDDDDQPHQSCSGAARRRPCSQRQGEPQPSTSAAAYGPKKARTCNNGPPSNSNPNPQEFLSKIAGTFLPGLLETLAAAGAGPGSGKPSTSASAPEQGIPKGPEEFLSTAAAFASTYFPEFYDALVGGNNKKDEVTKPAASASVAPVPVQPTKSSSGFEVKLNVSDYTPEELSVKTIENSIIIEGKQQEKADDQGFVSRSFSRRFVIPDNVKPDTVECKLTSDGFLVLSAPLVVKTPTITERSIPINMSVPEVTPVASAPNVEDIGDEDTGSSKMSVDENVLD